jgi:hypothetical protein
LAPKPSRQANSIFLLRIVTVRFIQLSVADFAVTLQAILLAFVLPEVAAWKDVLALCALFGSGGLSKLPLLPDVCQAGTAVDLKAVFGTPVLGKLEQRQLLFAPGAFLRSDYVCCCVVVHWCLN